MYKKIIAFLFSFSIVVSLFSASASAADIYGGGAGRLTDFWSLSYKMWQDGQSDWNPGGIFTAGGGGRDDFASRYADYVSTLKTPSVSSSDLSSGSSTTYTLLDLSGRYESRYVSSSSGSTPEYTEFGVGDFPLSFSTYISYSSGATKGNPYAGFSFSGVSACAGDVLTFTYYFPSYSLSYTSSFTVSRSFSFYGSKPNSDSMSSYCSFGINSNGSLSVRNGMKVLSLNYPALFDSDTLTYQSITDSSGSVIGVSASGTLLYDLNSLAGSASFSYSLSSPPSGYNYTNFDSYDDLTITVSSSGSGSGSSSLPDESTRLGPVMQSINNYNIDNSYTDNSTTVNYYLTPNNGETLCSPVVFDESTKVFTVPETGQQFLCDYWIYHYTPDNTLTLNGVEFSGNYLGSYILRLADSSYVIGDTVVPAVWVVYMDEKVYVIPYYTNTETGNIVPLDFQPYSYAMVSQSSCSINGHTYTSDTTQPPTCVASGERKYTCSVCGNEYVEDIPATGVHSYQFSVLQEATCTAAGIGLHTCSNCGDQYTEPIAATGHTDHVLEIVPTVYDEEGIVVSLGYTVYECTVCGYQHRVNDDIEADSESLLSGLTGAIKSFSKSIWSAISSGIGKVFSGFTDMIGGIFGFLSDTVLGGVKNFFSSFSDSSILDIFQQENEDGSTTTTLPEGMSGAMATVGGFITGLPSELLGVLVFGIALLLLLAALKLLL